MGSTDLFLWTDPQVYDLTLRKMWLFHRLTPKTKLSHERQAQAAEHATLETDSF